MARDKLPNQREAELLAILINGEKYGREIRDEYEKRTKTAMPYGSLYTTLSRMEDKGFLESRFGDGGPERDGYRKKFFKITAPGMRAVNAFGERASSIFGLVPSARGV